MVQKKGLYQRKDDVSTNKGNKNGLQSIREVVSDTEEESHGKLSIHRKVDMLNVRDMNEEFEMKSQCMRRKSLDFERERQSFSRHGSGSKGKSAAA